MGREVYHGDPKGVPDEILAYDQGVREGAFGLLLNSVVLGINSFLIEPMCQRMGARLVWAMSNFIVFACMAGISIISLFSVSEYSEGIQHVLGGSKSIRIASLVVFTLLGFPLSITYSVPFSVTAELTSDTGGGQAIIKFAYEQYLFCRTGYWGIESCNFHPPGPWDALFGGDNIPAIVPASVFSLLGGVITVIRLPKVLGTSYKSTDTGNRACFFFIHLALWPHYRPCGRFNLALVFEVINVFQSPDQRNSASAIFCLWMAAGNILGFSAGSNGNWYSINVFEMAPSLNVVELRKTGGDTLEFNNFYKSFSSRLKDIVWKSEGNSEETRS
ncbi:hypothetical protein GIB67_022098 [Kingdonia uniflora]|uniref:Uncharacterized protein n=1 Tax=Kingdonia uniflora TaxID=39325 RepID=A0A7J7LY34_9MAGN|nr:hypothetical protein GIB67_022098 [Kingdonia uniflora]